MTSASDAEKLLANHSLQMCISHKADAIRVPRAASPAQLTINTMLVHEPAASEACADTSVAIAMLQALIAHVFEPCPEPNHSSPALTAPTSTSSNVSTNSLQQSRVSNHTNTLITLWSTFPMLSASAMTAVAVLVAAIDVMGPPTILLACPMHVFCRAKDFSCKLESLTPCTSLAMSIKVIDEDLLENIIKDMQNQMRIEARCEVRVNALQEGREHGWKEGLEEGKEVARREVRRDTRAEVRQWEQSWKDGYEQGR